MSCAPSAGLPTPLTLVGHKRIIDEEDLWGHRKADKGRGEGEVRVDGGMIV